MFNRIWSLLRTTIIVVVILGLLMNKRHKINPSSIITPEAKELIAITLNKRKQEAAGLSNTTPNMNQSVPVDTGQDAVANLVQQSETAATAQQRPAAQSESTAVANTSIAEPTVDGFRDKDSVTQPSVKTPTVSLSDPNALLQSNQSVTELVDKQAELEQHLEEVLAYGDEILDALLTISYYPEARPDLCKVFKVVGREVYGSLEERNQYTSIERQISKRMLGYQPGVEMRVIVNQQLEEAESTAIIDSLNIGEDPMETINRIQQTLLKVALDSENQEIYYATILDVQINVK